MLYAGLAELHSASDSCFARRYMAPKARGLHVAHKLWSSLLINSGLHRFLLYRLAVTVTYFYQALLRQDRHTFTQQKLLGTECN